LTPPNAPPRRSLEGEPHFFALCQYISSGPVVALALEKDDACASLRATARALAAKFGSGAELIKPTVHASADDRTAYSELKLFFPRTFPRDAAVAIAPVDDVIFAAAMKDGFLCLATKDVQFTPEQAAVLAADSADPKAKLAALTAGPLVAALLERPFAVEALAELRSPTTVHISSSPTAALTEAEGIFGSAVKEMQTTFAFVKPDAFENAAVILAQAEASGFSILASSSFTLSNLQAAEFYAEHDGKPFYGKLTGFMTSGPVVAMVLQRPCAIAAWRSLIGPTNSLKAVTDSPLSLRARFGTDGTFNACHGSDSVASAAREAGFFFPELAQMQTTFALLTPDAAGAVDRIIAAAANAGLVVTNRLTTLLTQSRAADFLYLLGPAAPPLAPTPPRPTPIISAVVAGVAMQLYNPSSRDMLLDSYSVVVGPQTVSLTGKIAPAGGMFVLYASDAAEGALPTCAEHKMQCSLDAISMALLKDGVVLDIVGSLEASGSTKPWPVAGVSRALALHSIVRKAWVTAGNSRPWGDAALSSQGTSADTSEWVLLPKEAFAQGSWSLAADGTRAAWAVPPPPPGSHEAAVAHLTSGPVTALTLSGTGAVARWNALMGPANPLEAKVRCPGCLRARFGANETNIVGYSSASAEAAFRQSKFFFPSTLVDPLPDSKAAKAYVQEALMPTLTAGLVELCLANPANPTAWLAEWLAVNNPNKPAVA
jgi:nucleoside diphosphate kinase